MSKQSGIDSAVVRSDSVAQAPTASGWLEIFRQLPETLKVEISLSAKTLKLEISSGWIIFLLLVAWLW